MLTLLGFATLTILAAPPVAAAGSATLSLSTSAPVRQGEELAVTLSVTSTEPINVVESYITYDQSKLTFKSIAKAGPFSQYDDQSGGGNGIVSGVHGALTPVSGTNAVATIRFTVKAASGSTSLSFGAGTIIGSSGAGEDVWNGNTTGATYSFVGPQPQGQGGTAAPKSGTPSNPTTPVADEPVPVAPAGGEAAGYIVNIIVKNNESPVSDAEVTIGETAVKTDDTGVASFLDLPAGEYNVKIKTVDFEREQSITVEPLSDHTSAQEFEVQHTTDTSTSSVSVKTVAIIGLVIVSAAAILFALLQQRRGGRPTSGGTAATGQVFSNGATAAPSASPTSPSTLSPSTQKSASPSHIEPVVISPTEGGGEDAQK